MLLENLLPEFKQYCLRERGIQPKSYYTIQQHLRQFCFQVGEQDVHKIGTEIIRTYLYERSKSRAWSAKTFRNHLQSIQSFYTWMKKKMYIQQNPTKGIEKPRLPRILPRYLHEKQVELVLYHLQNGTDFNKFKSFRNYVIIHTFLKTGLRLNELRLLELDDIDLETASIRVKKGKGQKMRIIPIHPRLLPILKRYDIELQRQETYALWFFPSLRAVAPMSQSYIQGICKRISIRSGVKFTPHMLRHTFGRRCTDENLPFYKLKEIMGHSSITTTERYASVSMRGIQDSFMRVCF